MSRTSDPFRFFLITVAGWMNQRQLQAIDYLREENRVLREQLGDRRLRLTDDQRRRLAAKAKGLGRKILSEVATIVTPETLLAWHRKLIAEKVRRQPQARIGTAAHGRRVGSSGRAHGRRKPRVGYRRIQGALSNLGTNLPAAQSLTFCGATASTGARAEP
jgi:hypothetical protein